MTNASDAIIDLYRRRASEWDDARGRGLMERPWLDRFLALVPAGGSVLDVGCGGGEPIARYVIAQGRKLTGVDSSGPLITLCRTRFPAAAFAVADMRTMAIAQTFDGIIAWDSFFHLTADDQRGMFPIFGQHANSNAALLFTSGPAAGEAIGELHGEALHNASLDPEEYRSLLSQSGFQVMELVLNDASCGGHTIWLARKQRP